MKMEKRFLNGKVEDGVSMRGSEFGYNRTTAGTWQLKGYQYLVPF